MFGEAPPRAVARGDRHALTLVEGGGDRIRQASPRSVGSGETIHQDHHVSSVADAGVGVRLVEPQRGAVDLRANEPRGPQLRRRVDIGAVGGGGEGETDGNLGTRNVERGTGFGHLFRVPRSDFRNERIHHRLHRVALDDRPAIAAKGRTAPRPEQAQIVVDLRRRPDGGAARRGGVLLLDRHGRRDALEGVQQRLGHALEELLRIGRQRLDVAPLALGVQRIERQGALPRPGRPRDHGERPARELDRDPLQVVLACVAKNDAVRYGAHNLET